MTAWILVVCASCQAIVRVKPSEAETASKLGLMTLSETQWGEVLGIENA